MEWAIPVVLFIGFFIYFSLNKASTKGKPSYIIKNAIFSPAERSFWGVLTLATSDGAVVFGKVRIADILEPHKRLSGGEWQSAFNKISSKHFDFVICNSEDLAVISVVELDDKSHNWKKQALRDEFIQGICEGAGLKLHRFKASDSYSLSYVRDVLFPLVTPTITVGEQAQNSSKENDEQVKFCPKCSSKLVLKISNKGKHKGEKFFGCSAFPNCRYILKTDK